jgi:hypothetical protein
MPALNKALTCMRAANRESPSRRSSRLLVKATGMLFSFEKFEPGKVLEGQGLKLTSKCVGAKPGR